METFPIQMKTFLNRFETNIDQIILWVTLTPSPCQWWTKEYENEDENITKIIDEVKKSREFFFQTVRPHWARGPRHVSNMPIGLARSACSHLMISCSSSSSSNYFSSSTSSPPSGKFISSRWKTSPTDCQDCPAGRFCNKGTGSKYSLKA